MAYRTFSIGAIAGSNLSWEQLVLGSGFSLAIVVLCVRQDGLDLP